MNSRHRCIIYDGAPSEHLPIIAAAVAERLSANHRCLYLNSPPMIAGMRARLMAGGVNVQEAVGSGKLILTSDQTHLIDGEFDPPRMLDMLSAAAESAKTDGFAGLWATGDMLWEFGSEKNFSKLLDYELRLDELLKANPAISGICQYHRDVLPADALHCALFAHESLYVNQTLARMNPYYMKASTLKSSPVPDDIYDMLDHLRREINI